MGSRRAHPVATQSAAASSLIGSSTLVTPTISALRKLPQLAAVSQWMFTFGEAIGEGSFSIDNLENDLDPMTSETSTYYPALVVKLLSTLTLNRHLSSENYETEFRKQLLKRDVYILGNEDDPRTVTSLSAAEKLEILLLLCEAQFDHADRFRSLLDDGKGAGDEQEHWRVNPLGYDASGNIYWLFDDNRLCVERQKGRKRKVMSSAASLSASKATKTAQKSRVTPQRPVEARTSSRLRGSKVSYREDVLSGEARSSSLDLSDDSSLSDLDDLPDTADQTVSSRSPSPQPQEACGPQEVSLSQWDAVCVTLQEWRAFPGRFAQSKHADEKALHRLLVRDVCPQILAELEEKERRRLLDLAISNRKRSSRIADKEVEKEQRLREERMQKEQEAKLDRLRNTEDRKVSEEKLARDLAKERDERIKERESRIAQRQEALINAQIEEAQKRQERLEERERRRDRGMASKSLTPAPMPDQATNQNSALRQESPPHEIARSATAQNGSSKKTTSERKQQKLEGTWVFDCVCGIVGKNYDDGRMMIACERCEKWQHLECTRKEELRLMELFHQSMTSGSGAPGLMKPRAWNPKKDDFVCFKCQTKAHAKKLRRIERQREQSRLKEEGSSASGLGLSASSQPTPRIKMKFNGVPRETGPEQSPDSLAEGPAKVTKSEADDRGIAGLPTSLTSGQSLARTGSIGPVGVLQPPLDRSPAAHAGRRSGEILPPSPQDVPANGLAAASYIQPYAANQQRSAPLGTLAGRPSHTYTTVPQTSSSGYGSHIPPQLGCSTQHHGHFMQFGSPVFNGYPSFAPEALTRPSDSLPQQPNYHYSYTGQHASIPSQLPSYPVSKPLSAFTGVRTAHTNYHGQTVFPEQAAAASVHNGRPVERTYATDLYTTQN